MTKFWISKYALTEGLVEIELDEPDPEFPNMISTHGTRDGRWHIYHGEGREWHRSREQALARAEEMRIAKIASLQKSIKKMQAKSFVE